MTSQNGSLWLWFLPKDGVPKVYDGQAGNLDPIKKNI